MPNAQLVQKISETASLTGEFTLRSGQTSRQYFDKYRFEGDPALLKALTHEMAKLLPTDTQIIAGLELGGVPLATALSLETGLPAAFIRKEAKTYDTCRAIEGQDVAGKNITFIEDIITTGGAVAEAAQRAHDAQAHLLAVVCAIWRGQGTPHIAALPNLPVLPVFTQDDLTQSHA